MTEATEPLLDATTALLPPLLTALETLEQAGRHLYPSNIPTLAEAAAGCRS